MKNIDFSPQTNKSSVNSNDNKPGNLFGISASHYIGDTLKQGTNETLWTKVNPQIKALFEKIDIKEIRMVSIPSEEGEGEEVLRIIPQIPLDRSRVVKITKIFSDGYDSDLDKYSFEYDEMILNPDNSEIIDGKIISFNVFGPGKPNEGIFCITEIPRLITWIGEENLTGENLGDGDVETNSFEIFDRKIISNVFNNLSDSDDSKFSSGEKDDNGDPLIGDLEDHFFILSKKDYKISDLIPFSVTMPKYNQDQLYIASKIYTEIDYNRQLEIEFPEDEIQFSFGTFNNYKRYNFKELKQLNNTKDASGINKYENSFNNFNFEYNFEFDYWNPLYKNFQETGKLPISNWMKLFEFDGLTFNSNYPINLYINSNNFSFNGLTFNWKNYMNDINNHFYINNSNEIVEEDAGDEDDEGEVRLVKPYKYKFEISLMDNKIVGKIIDTTKFSYSKNSKDIKTIYISTTTNYNLVTDSFTSGNSGIGSINFFKTLTNYDYYSSKTNIEEIFSSSDLGNSSFIKNVSSKIVLFGQKPLIKSEELIELENSQQPIRLKNPFFTIFPSVTENMLKSGETQFEVSSTEDINLEFYITSLIDGTGRTSTIGKTTLFQYDEGSGEKPKIIFTKESYMIKLHINHPDIKGKTYIIDLRDELKKLNNNYVQNPVQYDDPFNWGVDPSILRIYFNKTSDKIVFGVDVQGSPINFPFFESDIYNKYSDKNHQLITSISKTITLKENDDSVEDEDVDENGEKILKVFPRFEKLNLGYDGVENYGNSPIHLIDFIINGKSMINSNLLNKYKKYLRNEVSSAYLVYVNDKESSTSDKIFNTNKNLIDLQLRTNLSKEASENIFEHQPIDYSFEDYGRNIIWYYDSNNTKGMFLKTLTSSIQSTIIKTQFNTEKMEYIVEEES